jgi:hypothetical protein
MVKEQHFSRLASFRKLWIPHSQGRPFRLDPSLSWLGGTAANSLVEEKRRIVLAFHYPYQTQ